jgi:hypothetical protein
MREILRAVRNRARFWISRRLRNVSKVPLTEKELRIAGECLRAEIGGSKEDCRAIAQRVFTSDSATWSESDARAFNIMHKNLKNLHALIFEGKFEVLTDKTKSK